MKRRFHIFPVIIIWAMTGAAWAEDIPVADFALRKELFIVGSETMKPFVDAAVSHYMARRKDTPAPVIAAGGTTAGIKAFCGGLGVEFPDIVASSRRMSRPEFKNCVHNKVEKIDEIVIGYGAVVVVGKRGAETFNLEPEQVYRALARDIPIDEEFALNTHKKWKDINASLPDIEIKVFAPPLSSGSRSVFDDLIMQAGCRYVPEIRTIYKAADRVAKCVTPRSDGRFVIVDESTPPADIFRDAQAGALFVTDRSHWVDDAKNLSIFPINGLLPTEQSIVSGEYPLSRRLYFYFKMGHMRNAKGFGVARGLREFMITVTSDEAMEPGGYFEREGLILLSREERARQRLETVSLTPMQR